VHSLGYEWRMKRWLVLGLVGLALAWGPYLYSELVSSPVRVHGKTPHGPRFLGATDDSEEEATEPEPEAEEPEQPAAEKAALTAEPKTKAADAPGDTAPGLVKKAAEPAGLEKHGAEPSAQKPGEQGEPGSPDEPEPPTLPAELLPAFRKVFEAEPRDAFWANDEELKVHALFKDAGGSPDALSAVVCRTTVCRVTFTPDELETESLTKLYLSLRARYAGSLALEAKPGAVGERATLFVLRAGYKLER
jgi:hypothetical protein